MILHPDRPGGRRVVLCDRCGRDCRATDEHPDFREDDNPLEGDFQHRGCYGSTRYDLMHLSAQLCEDCVVALVQWIDAGRPDSPGGPAKGSGVTIIDSTPREELAYAKDAGLPTTVELEDGTVWHDVVQREHVDPERFRDWVERKYRTVFGFGV